MAKVSGLKPKGAASKAKAKTHVVLKHPPYLEMVRQVIIDDADKTGTSRQTIKKRIANKYGLDPLSPTTKNNINRAIHSGMEKKEFLLPKGLTGKVKLAGKVIHKQVEPKVIKPKKQKPITEVKTKKKKKPVTEVKARKKVKKVAATGAKKAGSPSKKTAKKTKASTSRKQESSDESGSDDDDSSDDDDRTSVSSGSLSSDTGGNEPDVSSTDDDEESQVSPTRAKGKGKQGQATYKSKASGSSKKQQPAAKKAARKRS
ncbi:uncharacterized protein PFL1_02332 [Pseudozyma flocculosa PF-1]|uniref:uncharacterized protein n=1 Tax=Pseudozyma flocculosa PF-1 TaxID=1277687 RepID=UPI0004560E27|nr:uncharacterized protein PFL1_02332 [Pseudozyma flocculosa PF-1]EPQ30216.1 hypothetical protein PFL1_02332 [Pseudozyma flocculosa PF-1]